jgi:hypothetical protein
VSSYFSFKLGLVQRSKGQSAAKRSAYQLRGTALLSDGSIVDYSDREDHVAHFVMAPLGAPEWTQDRECLWAKAMAAEKRIDAQEARLLEVSLPRGLAREDLINLGRQMGSVLVAKGMVVQVDIHCPLARDGLTNPHVHIMATLREIKDGEFSSKKARHWNRYFHGKAALLRAKMAAALNTYCKERGIDYHADPRSNAQRGLLPAEARLPRWNFLHYARTGENTPALARLDRERAARAEIARLRATLEKTERELLSLTAANAKASRSAYVHSPKVDPQHLLPSRNRAAVGRLEVRSEKLGTSLDISTDPDLDGARYGP